MANRDYVLQRCTRRTRKTSTWQTICLPVSYREGLAQLAAVADHPRPHLNRFQGWLEGRA